MTTLPPSLTNQEAPVGSLPGLLSRSAAADGTGNRGEGTGVPRILIHSAQGLTGACPEISRALVNRRTGPRVLGQPGPDTPAGRLTSTSLSRGPAFTDQNLLSRILHSRIS